MRYKNRNLSKTNPFHRFDHLVDMDHRSNDFRWQLALADASARKRKRALVKVDDSLMYENREVEKLESSSAGIQVSPQIVHEAKYDTLSRKLSLAKFEKRYLEFKVQKLEDEIIQLDTSRAYLLATIQNHNTSAKAGAPERDVDLSEEIARYEKLIEEGEKRLSQFRASPQTIQEETLFCGFQGVPLCSMRSISQGLRKVGVGSKNLCQIL